MRTRAPAGITTVASSSSFTVIRYCRSAAATGPFAFGSTARTAANVAARVMRPATMNVSADRTVTVAAF